MASDLEQIDAKIYPAKAISFCIGIIFNCVLVNMHKEISLAPYQQIDPKKSHLRNFLLLENALYTYKGPLYPGSNRTKTGWVARYNKDGAETSE